MRVLPRNRIIARRAPGFSLGALIAAIMFLSGPAGCDTEEKRLKIDPAEVVGERELARAPDPSSSRFFFGFDLRSTPQEDARQYIPFIRYLERATGLDIELRFTPKDGEIVDDLGRGVVHFAAIGAGSYLQAHEEYGVIPLARGLNAEGRAEYQAVVVVAPESPLRRIQDVKGKRFAFGSATSTQGYLIPRIILYKHGILLRDLASYVFTGSHFNCADEVETGRADACGLQDTLGKRLAAKGRLRILYVSEYYPSSGIAANRDVAPAIRDRVKKALLDFQPKGRDAAGLYNWDATEMPNGFVAASVEDYRELELWAERFHLLPEKGQ